MKSHGQKPGMDHLNIDRFLKVWSEILTEHYGVKITLTAIRKEEKLREETQSLDNPPP